MPRVKLVMDAGILSAALSGLEAQRQRLEEQIAQVRAMLGKRKRGRPPKAAGKPRVARRLGAAARKRISAAQKRRWEAFRKRQGAAGKA